MHDSSGGTLKQEEDCRPTVYWFSEIHKKTMAGEDANGCMMKA
jgi:hypothetical protein